MERFYNSRNSSQSYYEIFSSCRLCGSGGGYKMPIVQKISRDVITAGEVELQIKIKECVAIEVVDGDKMPPLICELCVDKIDDFYEFREMCKSTNTRIRSLFGLPPQTLTQEVSEDCILGISGPVFKSSNEESPAKGRGRGRPQLSAALKKDSKSTRKASPDPPKRVATRGKEKDVKKREPSPPPLPRSTRHGKPSPQTSSKHESTLKRDRDRINAKENEKDQRNNRKVRISEPPSRVGDKRRLSGRSESPLAKRSAPSSPPPRALRAPAPAKPSPRSTPAPKSLPARAPPSRAPPAKAAPAPPPAEPKYKCEICPSSFHNPKSLTQHMKTSHSPSFTSERVSCNPCGEWYASAEELATHHKWHRSADAYYHCHRCTADFKFLSGYQRHFEAKQCVPDKEVPDLECPECLGKFPTKNWMDRHKCPGVDGRPGGKCVNCNKKYVKYKILMKHLETCPKKAPEARVSPVLLKRLLPMRVRVQKCDELLQLIRVEPPAVDADAAGRVRYDVSHVRKEYGLDSSAVYPYISARTKTRMGPDGVEYYSDEYSGSDFESGSDEENQDPGLKINPFARNNLTEVESLSTISLRAIFSSEYFRRRRPRRQRRRPRPTEATSAVVEDEVDKSQDTAPEDVSNNENEDTSVDNTLDDTAERADEASKDGDHVANEADVVADNETAKDDATCESVADDEATRGEIESAREDLAESGDVDAERNDKADADDENDSPMKEAESNVAALDNAVCEDEPEPTNEFESSIKNDNEPDNEVEDSLRKDLSAKDEEETEVTNNIEEPEKMEVDSERPDTAAEEPDEEQTLEKVVSHDGDSVKGSTNDLGDDANGVDPEAERNPPSPDAPVADAADGGRKDDGADVLRNGDDAFSEAPEKPFKDTCDDLDSLSDGEMFDI